MTIYQQTTSVTLTNSQWLRVTIALFDAIQFLEEKNYPISATEVTAVLDEIREQTKESLEAAHQETIDSLARANILNKEREIVIDNSTPF